jgi:hypothetical protein
MFLDMGLDRLFSMATSVNGMAGRGVGMVRGGFMVTRLVMLGGFPMVAGGMAEMFRGLFVVLCGFF